MTPTPPPSPSSHTLRGQLLWPDGTLQAGTLRFSERIEALERVDAGPDAAGADAGDLLILPGFIDTHVHGGGGGDTMDGAAGIRTLSRLHARHGTTTIVPTTITNPWPQVMAALRAVREVMDAGGVPGGADVVGAHLEGPFISPRRLGAQPPCTLEPTPARVAELLALDVIRAVTLAPEVAHGPEAALAFAAAGVRVGIGHTVAGSAEVEAVLGAVHAAGGRSAATHLYNAMGGVQGRDPGPAGALMADPFTFLEVILDLIHVHPTSFRLACAAAPGRVVLVTDAMRAAGLGDGESELGGQPVTVRGTQVTLADGTLAGSVLTMDAALRHAVQAGVSLADASRMASLTPALSLGLRDRGELRAGLRADLVVLGGDLRVRAVYVGGVYVDRQEVSE